MVLAARLCFLVAACLGTPLNSDLKDEEARIVNGHDAEPGEMKNILVVKALTFMSWFP